MMNDPELQEIFTDPAHQEVVDMLKASRPAGTIDGFLGLLAGKTGKVATIDEINDAAAAGWAGQE